MSTDIFIRHFLHLHADSVLAAALDPLEAHKESVSAQPQLPAMPVPQTKPRRKTGLRQ